METELKALSRQLSKRMAAVNIITFTEKSYNGFVGPVDGKKMVVADAKKKYYIRFGNIRIINDLITKELLYLK